MRLKTKMKERRLTRHMTTKKATHKFIVRFRNSKDRKEIYLEDFVIRRNSQYYVAREIAEMLHACNLIDSNNHCKMFCTIKWNITPHYYILSLTLD